MTPRLKELYNNQIKESLMKKFSLPNKLMVPEITKVVLNMGLGAEGTETKKIKTCVG